ncbi:MAG: hypothetical protein HY819_20525 [Acidobacteria bacterium]|nr:hypothetical protein [Acidobacteriota bacterium]
MSAQKFTGTYEIEVRLGPQEVCFLEFDMPESEEELRKVKVDPPGAEAEELVRGLLSTVFSLSAGSQTSRNIQIYDLMNNVASVREAVEEGESLSSIKTKLEASAQDDIARISLRYFCSLIELLPKNKALELLSQFSKFLFTKKEALPKAASVSKVTKDSPRWDRVVKQNVLINDEPTQDIEVNALEEEVTEDAEPLETEWTEAPSDIEPIGESELDDDEMDHSEIT